MCTPHLREYKNCVVWLNHSTTLILIIVLYNILTVKILGIHGCREGIHSLKPAHQKKTGESVVAATFLVFKYV